MAWYQYFSLVALVICFFALLWHFFKLIKKGRPKDLSKKVGNIPKAEAYSFTIAMLPNQKESAYLHLPTFISGIFFHISIFLSLLLFILFFFISPNIYPIWLKFILVGILLLGSICGFGLFLKRMFAKKLRALSHLDDFISNCLATLFQLFTAIYLLLNIFEPFYYVMVGILFLYMPIGKLRHVVYFFAARWQLGFFYGWRNSWPPKKEE